MPKLPSIKAADRIDAEAVMRAVDPEADDPKAEAERLIRHQLDVLDVVARSIKQRADKIIAEQCEIDRDGLPVWSEALCNYGAMVGYFTLVWLAERGDKDAAKWLAEKGLGAPVQPYRLQIQNYTKEEAVRELYLALVAEGKTDAKAREIIREMTGEAVPELPPHLEFPGG